MANKSQYQNGEMDVASTSGYTFMPGLISTPALPGSSKAANVCHGQSAFCVLETRLPCCVINTNRTSV